MVNEGRIPPRAPFFLEESNWAKKPPIDDQKRSVRKTVQATRSQK
jgi:hypothetical protein